MIMKKSMMMMRRMVVTIAASCKVKKVETTCDGQCLDMIMVTKKVEMKKKRNFMY